MRKFKNIMVLMGKSNSGKTNTLQVLINKLIIIGFVEIERNKTRKRKRKDSLVLLKNKGKYVLIFTGGDSKKMLQEAIKEAEEVYPNHINKCNTFVCACHIGNSSNFLCKMATRKIVFYVNKYIVNENNKKKLNLKYNKQAKEILADINRI